MIKNNSPKNICTFERSKTKPKLQNSRLVNVQGIRYYLRLITLVFGIGLMSVAAYGQDIPPKNEVNIPAETEQDSIIPPSETITIPQDSLLSETNERLADSVRTDSVQPQQEEVLTDIVDYYGEDYVYLNRKEKKIYMYNEAYVIYGDMRIDAGLIIFDYSKSEVYAKGIDSAGVYSQLPVFKQATNEVRPDSIRFNFDTQKALVYNSRTEQNGFRVISETTKKENDSVYYLSKVKFTTSENIDDPEYYFYTRKAKFVPQRKIVTGLTNMYIADVPTPIGLPFAYFPLTEDRTSGFIIPTIGDNNNRGFFFQNGGYYFAVSEYFDLTLLGDYYTNGSYGLRGESSYAVRYKFRGNINVRYENLINSERGFPDFSQTSVYNIRWSHQQDPKSSPLSRFSASVNLGSSQYFTQSINQVNNASSLVNTLSSSVSYSKTFETQPEVNIQAAATHTQNTNTQAITMSLPNVTANISRIFPFAPKTGSKKGILQNINLQYDVSAQNRIETTDSLFFKSEMFDTAQLGAQHTIPISTNFKILKYLSATAGSTYQETWVGTTFPQRFDPDANNGEGAVVRDTVRGFDSYRTYNFSSGLGTTLYGTFNFGKGKKIEAIRHVVRPSINYSISPGFDQFFDEYTIPSIDPEVVDEVVQYSRFQNTLFGAPSQEYSSGLTFGISNTLEAKVRNPDTTATEPKKITLLNNLNFSSGYGLSRDSLKFDPVRVTGGLPIVDRLDLNFNGTLNPYALDNNNQIIDEFNINNGGSLFRLTGGNVSLNYSFSSKDFERVTDDEGDRDPDRFDNETFRNGGRPDDLFGDVDDFDGSFDRDDRATTNKLGSSWYDYSIPWNMRVAYTLTYSNNARENRISSQSLMFSSNVELSPRWSVGLSSGYDFTSKGVTLTQLRFQRDLESWQMSFNWTPIGARTTSWYFLIQIKASILKDIKYDKRREPDRGL